MIDITAQAINWRGYPVALLSDGVCRLLGTDDPQAFTEGRSPAYHLRLALATATDTAESDEPSGWYFTSRLLAQSVCIEAVRRPAHPRRPRRRPVVGLLAGGAVMPGLAAETLPVVARVFPPGCGFPGCLHHYHRPRRVLVREAEPLIDGCACVAWPADRDGAHLIAVNPLCQAHHTIMELVEDAADNLACRGYLDPDDDGEIPPEVAAELLAIYLAGPCGLCPGWPSPDNLAEHFLTRKQEEWERFGIAPWWCDCGAIYKPLTEFGATTYYSTTDPDGLLGDPAGMVKRNSKGVVKDSGACPACGRLFAETVARQTVPEGALF